MPICPIFKNLSTSPKLITRLPLKKEKNLRFLRYFLVKSKYLDKPKFDFSYIHATNNKTL